MSQATRVQRGHELEGVGDRIRGVELFSRMRFTRPLELDRVLNRASGPFAEVYELVAAGRSRKALKPLYQALSGPLLRDAPAETDALLRELDLTRLDVKTMVGTLTVTFHARDELPARAALFDSVRERLERLAPERVDGLLSGLGQSD